MKRHQIPTEGKDPQAIRIIERGKQSPVAHAKYRDAIVACDSMNCIDMNILIFLQTVLKFSENEE